MKKKILITFVLCLVMGVFFCSSVFADTYMSVDTAKSLTANNNNVYCEIKVVQLKGSDDPVVVYNGAGSSSGDPVGTYASVQVLVQVKFTNYNNYPCTVRSFAPRIVFTNNTLETYRRVTNIVNYTDEMYLSITNASSYFDVLPSVYFGDGSLVDIPPHRSISAIATVELNIEYGATDLNAIASPHIDHIELYNNGFFAEQTSVWPIGTNDEINNTLDEILSALQGNSGTNSDVSSDSGTLKTESDAIHQQEQTYYSQNQQAIEATGLRNYNFSQAQGDGIARVSLDFTNLWNSLGSFNGVYIFSLTLGLALTILRHSPSAISSAIRRQEYQNSARNDPKRWKH